ncbi:hypothetical protein H8356DRAFT_1331949 [Neocallimastix lanati (nom. inval.)]|nr:hypothetical protein H8356DRAFT_1331949 [Neocallimastix sp. JGI-2020a]
MKDNDNSTNNGKFPLKLNLKIYSYNIKNITLKIGAKCEVVVKNRLKTSFLNILIKFSVRVIVVKYEVGDWEIEPE